MKVCLTKGCERVLSGYALRNKLHTNHCSLYCKVSSERGDGRCHRRETLTRTCYLCDETFELKYPYNHANQRCCSKKCILQVESYKHGRRNFALLTVVFELASHDSCGFTAQDISDRMQKFPYNIKGPTGISQILKPFVKRGIMSLCEERGSKLKVYRWSDNRELKPGNVLKRNF